MNYIFILGRQPELGIAELEMLFGSDNVSFLSPTVASVTTEKPVDIQRIGGSSKAGVVAAEIPDSDWSSFSRQLEKTYVEKWSDLDRKQTLGLSVYDWRVSPKQIQGFGLSLKKRLKNTTTSLRLIPNQESSLNSAVSHHNKLGLSENKTELLIVKSKDTIIVAESVGAQNISALAARDQGRPKRDAFVGMLPPKLAMMMINMTGMENDEKTILDPFCGTGVLLQEAMLLGYDAYGSDLSDKMIDYSTQNLEWLMSNYSIKQTIISVEQGDAMTHVWNKPFDAVVCEGYLGQPFSAPPRPEKLAEVMRNCDHIMGSFLKNVAKQAKSGTPLVIGIPAWRGKDGQLHHLPLTKKIESYGFERISLKNVDSTRLAYFREDQVVARELLLLKKK